MYEHIIAYWAYLAEFAIKTAREDGATPAHRHTFFLSAEACLNHATAYTRLAVQAETRRAA